jgi:hypothetical protein
MRTPLLGALLLGALLLAGCTSTLDAVPHALLGVRGWAPVEGFAGPAQGAFFEVFLGSTDSSCPTFATPTVTIDGQPARLIDSGGMATSFDFVTSCQPATFAASGPVDPTDGVSVVVTQGSTRWTLETDTLCALRTYTLDLPADLVVHAGEAHAFASSVPSDHNGASSVTGVDAHGLALFTVAAQNDEPGLTRFTLPETLPPTLVALRLDQDEFDPTPACEGAGSCVVRCSAMPPPDLRVVLP